MKASIVAGAIVCGMLLTPLTLYAARIPCLAGDPEALGDTDDLAAVRAAVEAQCPCVSFVGTPGNGHRKYLSCVKAVLGQAARAKTLRARCHRRAMYSAGRTICGYPPSQDWRPCIHTGSRGAISCAIRPATSCSGARDARCSARTSCLDAADTNDDSQVTRTDSGACRPQDCAGQAAQRPARSQAWKSECTEDCINNPSYSLCVYGCTFGLKAVAPLFEAENAICAANPLASCEALYASTLEWCTNNPGPPASCTTDCKGDSTCLETCITVADCARAALESYQYCVQTF